MSEFFIRSNSESPQIETTFVDGKTYQIDALREHAKQFSIQEVSLDSVREAVGPSHIYWVDKKGELLTPFQIIQDWAAAQQNEAWADHVASIKRADLNNPIWMTQAGDVFDGVHRLTRAVLENRQTIKVRIFKNLP